jgi:hypothetical protein
MPLSQLSVLALALLGTVFGPAPSDVMNPSPGGQLSSAGAGLGSYFARDPFPQSLTLNPPILVGGGTGLATLTLDRPALPGGQRFLVGSYNHNLAVTPGFLIVPGGESSATFAISARACPTSLPVTISAGGLMATLLVVQATLTSFSVRGDDISPGGHRTGVVTLSHLAPRGGVEVTLTHTPASMLYHPRSVVVPEDRTEATFDITSNKPEGDTSVTLFARQTLGGITLQRFTHVTCLRRRIFRHESPTTVHAGEIGWAVVRLDGPALPGGLIVKLTNLDPLLCTVPDEVVIPEGQSEGWYSFQTVANRLGTARIKATMGGVILWLEKVIQW